MHADLKVLRKTEYGNNVLEAVESYLSVKENPLWWQEKGLQYTSSGYGKKIPTRYMVKFNNRWHRVYTCIFSNSGTLYIISKGKDIIVNIY